MSTTFTDLGERSRAAATEEEEEGTVGLPAAESELLESATDSASLLLTDCKDAAVGRKCAKYGGRPKGLANEGCGGGVGSLFGE